MAKKPNQPKNPTDPNLLARDVVEAAIGEPLIGKPAPPNDILSKYFAEMGRKGGLEGGKARAKKLSAKKRSQIAQQAAKKRWAKKRRSPLS